MDRMGILINCPNVYVGSVKPKLLQVTGDNLALNSMLGYVTSFMSNYYCRICKMYRRHAQREPIEDEGLLRNPGDYDDDAHTDPINGTVD